MVAFDSRPGGRGREPPSKARLWSHRGGQCNASRLQQVAWNLLTNAVKFTPEGGEVWVRLEGRGPVVELVVGEGGRGIAADFLPHADADRMAREDLLPAVPGSRPHALPPRPRRRYGYEVESLAVEGPSIV